MLAASMTVSWTEIIHMEVWKSQTWSICWWTVQLHYLCWVLYKLAKQTRPLTCLSADLAQALSLHIFPKLRLRQSLKAGFWTCNMSNEWINLVLSGLDLHSNNIVNESDHLMVFIQPHWLFSAEEPHGCKSRHPAQHMAGFHARAPRSHWGRRYTGPDGFSYSVGMIRLQQSLQLRGEKEKRFSTELQLYQIRSLL